MTATKESKDTNTKPTSNVQRRRRHWYDHEKLQIIDTYDKGDLKTDPAKQNNVIDPKSGESLPVFLIEGWRDAFRALGLIKRPKVEAPKQQPKQVAMPEGKDDIQKLLVNVLLENQKLKELISNLKHASMQRKSKQDTQDNGISL